MKEIQWTETVWFEDEWSPLWKKKNFLKLDTAWLKVLYFNNYVYIYLNVIVNLNSLNLTHLVRNEIEKNETECKKMRLTSFAEVRSENERDWSCFETKKAKLTQRMAQYFCRPVFNRYVSTYHYML